MERGGRRAVRIARKSSVEARTTRRHGLATPRCPGTEGAHGAGHAPGQRRICAGGFADQARSARCAVGQNPGRARPGRVPTPMSKPNKETCRACMRSVCMDPSWRRTPASPKARISTLSWMTPMSTLPRSSGACKPHSKRTRTSICTGAKTRESGL